MLSKKNRVNKELFLEIMNEGNVIYGSFFNFRFKKSKIPHFAFVAPKKIYKTAVLRNKYRRKGYNIINKFNLKINSGIFFYKKEALNVNLKEINIDIENILKKSKTI